MDDDAGDLGGAVGDVQHPVARGGGAAGTETVHHHCEGAIVHTAGHLAAMVHLSLHLPGHQAEVLLVCSVLYCNVIIPKVHYLLMFTLVLFSEVLKQHVDTLKKKSLFNSSLSSSQKYRGKVCVMTSYHYFPKVYR